MKNNSKTIVILGPTASGKSDLAVEIARQFDGEVISADSRQVYRGMDIGTGKITQREMRGVPHHLLDVASPKRRFSAGQYKQLGLEAVKEIRQRNKLPIVCGGTGFYIQALVDNAALPEVKPDLKLRAQLEKMNAQKLFAMLQKLDPERAKSIDRFNKRRLVRAIEIIKKTGRPVPKLQTRPDKNTLFIGIQKTPQELQKFIARRLKKRIGRGMVAEVQSLREQGLSWKKLEDFGLEYRWVARFLQNKISYQEMFERLQKEIEHYAKRQMTWFKRDKRIKWVEDADQAKNLVEKFLAK